jgi:hypothetical protein
MEAAMKDGFKGIIGRCVAAVVVASSERSDPRQQVFIVFDDGTRMEFYGKSFSCCSGVDPAAGIEEYVHSGGGKVVRVYGNADLTAAKPVLSIEGRRTTSVKESQDLEALLKRDVNAWNAARVLIARAKMR